jgi:hypothetical protein
MLIICFSGQTKMPLPDHTGPARSCLPMILHRSRLEPDTAADVRAGPKKNRLVPELSYLSTSLHCHASGRDCSLPGDNRRSNQMKKSVLLLTATVLSIACAAGLSRAAERNDDNQRRVHFNPHVTVIPPRRPRVHFNPHVTVIPPRRPRVHFNPHVTVIHPPRTSSRRPRPPIPPRTSSRRPGQR